MSRPGAIHRKIIELLQQHPDGLTSGQIRAKLNIAADEQAQLDRRRRDLRKWYVLEKRQSGNDWVYILKGERTEPVLERGVNIRVRAAVLGKAHGRCQMCGSTVAQHAVVLVVDHKIPVEWGGSNEEDNLWAICEECLGTMTQARGNREPAATAMALKTALDRVEALLTAKRGDWVPSTWLKAAAGTADWGRCVRQIRADGNRVRVFRKRRSGGRTLTYYSLC
jgi:5-methylcytosine-specific restriction endonuclease McrA